MYRFILLFVSVLCVTHLSGQTPLHSWELNNSYADVFGGNAMVPNGGTLTSTSYLFEKGEGPHVSNAIDPNTYSIVMRFTPHYIDSWAKVLDFKDRTVDGGIYISGGNFYFSASNFSILAVAYSVFTQDIPATVCLTRDGATKEVRGYVDGILHWTFVDTDDETAFTGPGNIIHILIDDLFIYNGVNAQEHSNGALDYFRIYNYEVTDPDIINPPCGNSDSDCDGIGNDCDVCPGGDDNGPCNATTLPSLSILPPNWLCNNNNNSDKILICHQGSTMGVSVNAANIHLAHGDFLGPCFSCSQNYSSPGSSHHFDAQNGIEPAYTYQVENAEEVNTNDLEVYPNPAKDLIYLQLPETTSERILIIHDQFGKTIWSAKVIPECTSSSININEKFADHGIYFISLISDDKIITRRFVVAKN